MFLHRSFLSGKYPTYRKQIIDDIPPHKTNQICNQIMCIKVIKSKSKHSKINHKRKSARNKIPQELPHYMLFIGNKPFYSTKNIHVSRQPFQQSNNTHFGAFVMRRNICSVFNGFSILVVKLICEQEHFLIRLSWFKT